MTRSVREFKKIGRNKYTRRQIAKQLALNKKRFSKVKADRLSMDTGRLFYYLTEPDDIKIEKEKLRHV